MNFDQLRNFYHEDGIEIVEIPAAIGIGAYLFSNPVYDGARCVVEIKGDYIGLDICHYSTELKTGVPPEYEDIFEVYKVFRPKAEKNILENLNELMLDDNDAEAAD